ncbi:MAG: hydroxymethylglutaryl-CoA lyase [Candidatus Fluviicola riflensis]|nr:MAG: hydroxymethylglutaryl-CoA lyase [Candidatus Fluviicola riflensis]OGS79601.1 MAG: hydroxymethylglutaryl-CoA lyase [Candidatus Fluviicola riflensis]OGS87032.1 MAG: hydroxymethylglutaryl-CoA lyase [Fluviicola sp. RIFCSPHIGHO2_01_FULL_43_53]OGS89824.1 MAG: hydroxymethylglutaryl-CoA lyase [Fluviicola sp. RIFCSPHIGHO2_12_FULL_43_24]
MKTATERVFITECPRDAMQGIHDWIPTDLKVAYINQLLQCGFDRLDCGSFVSPKAIPQLKDTREVLDRLDDKGTTKLLTIVANERGAEEAIQFDQIDFLGYPFSISETFQRRNTNASIEESLKRVEVIHNLCVKSGKSLVLYLSMGFGNPYGDEWNAELVMNWSKRLYDTFSINELALSDTIGAATPALVEQLFMAIIPELPGVKLGAHLHTLPQNAQVLVKAAYDGGCRYFDGAIKGYGGCPMAADDLTGNMPTEQMLAYFSQQGIETGILQPAFEQAIMKSSSVFL